MKRIGEKNQIQVKTGFQNCICNMALVWLFSITGGDFAKIYAEQESTVSEDFLRCREVKGLSCALSP